MEEDNRLDRPDPSPEQEDKSKKTKTSIVVDSELWGRFNGVLYDRLATRSFSRGLELVLANWLDAPRLQVTDAQSRRSRKQLPPDLEDLLAWFTTSRDPEDDPLRNLIRLRIKAFLSKKSADREPA